MKVYELKSEEELAAIWKRQQYERSNFHQVDTVPRIIEFFASGDPDKAASGEGRTAEGEPG